MARKPRIYYPGALYHVMARGNGKQQIFLDDEDYLAYQAFVVDALIHAGHRLHAYCWMSNHVHLLLQAGEQPISGMMQVVTQRYTQRFNRKYQQVGHLFQGRFKAQLVDGERYLLPLVRYIHTNPLRSGIVTQLEDYPWSSHLAYLQRAPRWLCVDWVLQQLGRSRTIARHHYLQLMGEATTPEQDARLSLSSEGQILGDEAFVARVMRTEGPLPRPLRCTLAQIAARVAEYEGVTEMELNSPSQRRLVSNARAIMTLLAVDAAGFSVTEVARYLNRDVTSVSRRLQRFRQYLQHDANERERIEDYIEMLKLQA